MTLKTLTVTGPAIESDVLKWLVENDFCKIQETLAAGSGSDNKVDFGTVVGRVKAATVVVGAPAFTGTGNGVLTRANPAYGVGVMPGTYKAQLIEAAANAGNFEVIRPDGTVDGIAVVGVAYVGQVNFTIADGSTDFSNAAQFILAVTVTAPSWKYWPLDLGQADGRQTAAGVALSKRTATDGGSDQPFVLLKRGPAIVDELHLLWPSGATDDQKSAAIDQLEALGIIVHAS